MSIDLRQLRHVLALDQYRNFARAASALGLTQPALSRSIQTLEKSIGARLFDRDRTRVEPTPVGERLIAEARPLLAHAGAITRDLQQMLGLEAGLIRIGAGPYPADISVGTAVGRLVRKHPGLRVDLSVDDWPTLVQRVVVAELDVVIAEVSLAVKDDRLAVEALPPRPAAFFARPNHPLQDCVGLTLEQVRHFPLVTTALPPRLAQLTDAKGVDLLSRLSEGVSTPEIRVETVDLVRRIVVESDAIGMAVMSQIQEDLALGRLVVLPLKIDWLFTNYGVIRLANRTLAPAVKTFIEILREAESEIV